MRTAGPATQSRPQGKGRQGRQTSPAKRRLRAPPAVPSFGYMNTCAIDGVQLAGIPIRDEDVFELAGMLRTAASRTSQKAHEGVAHRDESARADRGRPRRSIGHATTRRAMGSPSSAPCCSWNTSGGVRQGLVKLGFLTALVCAREKRGCAGKKEVFLHTKTIVIQFPNGDVEYDLARQIIPSQGETFRRNSVLWVVTRVEDEVVHVERVDERKST